jgi:hypothetical protein
VHLFADPHCLENNRLFVALGRRSEFSLSTVSSIPKTARGPMQGVDRQLELEMKMMLQNLDLGNKFILLLSNYF